MPTVFSFFPIFRQIVLRERINIVHGHASLSSMCHEAILHARAMGLKTCFTDHSLFGFADAGSILTNKLMKFTLSDVDHVICVSHTWYFLNLNP
jgi:phosphatidylinositol glycan class A protein